MEHDFYTMQDFFYHTKSVTYILIVAILFGFIAFWRFLTGRDDQ